MCYGYKPSLDFDEERIESSLSINHEITDQLGIGFTTQAVVEAEDVHTSYMLTMQYTPTD